MDGDGAARRPALPASYLLGTVKMSVCPLGGPGESCASADGVLEAARLGESVVVADERARREDARFGFHATVLTFRFAQLSPRLESPMNVSISVFPGSLRLS